MKIHTHDDQFDGKMYPHCGRGKLAVADKVFEATDPKLRCKICERDYFIHGQPEWHRQHAIEWLAKNGY